MMPAALKSFNLSARLLLLTVGFVMLAEVLIYVPSIARFRLNFLEQRLAAAQLASLALEATPDKMITPKLERELLANAGVHAVVLMRDKTRRLMLSDAMPMSVVASYDLRGATPAHLIMDAFITMWRRSDKLIRVRGPARKGGGEFVEIILDEKPLCDAMFDFSGRILTLSIIISLITAGLVYFALHLLFVRPMRRLTENMIAFRNAPEDAAMIIGPTKRSDELGVAQRELANMQAQIHDALRQKTRLAELGAAVSRISHDLRNILANAQLVSDRLAISNDPAVKRLAPSLISSIDRAISLCAQTLRYGRARESEPRRIRFELAPLIEDISHSVGLPSDGRVRWRSKIEDHLEVDADPDQVYRIILNLGRNAIEAIEGDGEITIEAHRQNGAVEIIICDSGPGLPPAARDNLFKPFNSSARAGGTGLGLAIARDLARAHGGDLELDQDHAAGACFRIILPDRPPE